VRTHTPVLPAVVAISIARNASFIRSRSHCRRLQEHYQEGRVFVLVPDAIEIPSRDCAQSSRVTPSPADLQTQLCTLDRSSHWLPPVPDSPDEVQMP
jgi:hypothetical protein